LWELAHDAAGDVGRVIFVKAAWLCSDWNSTCPYYIYGFLLGCLAGNNMIMTNMNPWRKTEK